jgi:hypothetical protein
MHQVKCIFSIGPEWQWNSGPAIGGEHNELLTPFKTIESVIYMSEESPLWYSLQLAVWPGHSYGYGFVKYDNGQLYCKVMAPRIGKVQEGPHSATIADLSVSANFM